MKVEIIAYENITAIKNIYDSFTPFAHELIILK